MTTGTARRAAALALLAIVPGALYALNRGENGVWLSALSVVIIAACIFLLFGGRDAEASPAP